MLDIGKISYGASLAIVRLHACSVSVILNNKTNGIKDAEMRELNREIATLREEKQDYKFGSMLGAYIGPLKQEIAEIKCHLPKTVVIPANDDYVRVDRSINAPYCNGFAFGAYGNPYGPFPGGGFFG